MRVVALRIDRMLIISNIHRGKPAQILGGEERTRIPISVEVADGVGVEMHIVAHLIKGNLKGIVLVLPIDDTVV